MMVLNAKEHKNQASGTVSNTMYTLPLSVGKSKVMVLDAQVHHKASSTISNAIYTLPLSVGKSKVMVLDAQTLLVVAVSVIYIDQRYRLQLMSLGKIVQTTIRTISSC